MALSKEETPQEFISRKVKGMPPDKKAFYDEWVKLNPPGSEHYKKEWNRRYRLDLGRTGPSIVDVKGPEPKKPFLSAAVDYVTELPSQAGEFIKGQTQLGVSNLFGAAGGISGQRYEPTREQQKTIYEPSKAARGRFIGGLGESTGVMRGEDQTKKSAYHLELESLERQRKITPKQKADLDRISREWQGGRKSGQGVGTGLQLAIPGGAAGGSFKKAALYGGLQYLPTVGFRNMIQPANSVEEVIQDVFGIVPATLIPAGFTGGGQLLKKGAGVIGQKIGNMIDPTLVNKVRETIASTVDDAVPVATRLDDLTKLIDEAPALKAKGVMGAKQIAALNARKKELTTKRVAELIGELVNKDGNDLRRAEAYRKLTTEFKDHLGKNANNVEAAYKKFVKQRMDDIEKAPVDAPVNPAEATFPKRQTVIKETAEEFYPTAKEVIPVDKSQRFTTKANKNKSVLQAAPGATIAAAGHTRAAQLEAEADSIESTDPERAKELRKQAAYYRTGGNLGLLGVAGGGLMGGLKVRGVGRAAQEVADEADDLFKGFFKDSPEANLGIMQIEGGDVRGGVKTLMETEGVPTGLVDTLQDLIDQGDERVVKETVSNASRMDKAAGRIASFGNPNDPQNVYAAAREYLRKAGINGKGTADDTVERTFLIKALNKHVTDGSLDPATKEAFLDTTLDLAFEHFKKGSKAGRELQVFTMMKRLSPEGLVQWGQNIASRAGSRLRPETAEKLMELSGKLQAGDINAIAEAKALIDRDIPPGPWERLASYRYLAMLANPATHIKNIVGNTGIAFTRKVEQGIGSAIDTGIGKLTGVRSVTAPTLKEGTQAGAKALVRGVGRANAGEVNPLMTGLVDIESGGTSKFGDITGGQRPMFENVPGLGLVEKGVRIGLNAADEGSFMGAYTNSLINDLKAYGINKGQGFDVPPDFVDKIMPGGNFDPKALQEIVPFEIPKWVFDNALESAQKATLKDSNFLTTLVGQTRRGLAGVGKGIQGAKRRGELPADFDLSRYMNDKAYRADNKEAYMRAAKDFNLGQIVLPFAQVPANLTMRAVERVPPVAWGKALLKIGPLKRAIQSGDLGNAQQLQRELVESFAQGTTGAAMMGIGAGLYGLGLMRPRDKDRKMEELKSAEGFPAGGLNVDGAIRAFEVLANGGSFEEAKAAGKAQQGDLIPVLDSLDPGYTLASGVAGGMQAAERGGITAAPDIALGVARGVGDSIMDRSFMSSLKKATGYGDPISGLARVAADVPGSFIPRPAGRVASALSGGTVDMDGGDLIERSVKGVAQNIPVLRDQLEIELDPLGREKTYDQPDNMALRIVGALGNPFKVGIVKNTPEGMLAIAIRDIELGTNKDTISIFGDKYKSSDEANDFLDKEKLRITGEVYKQFANEEPTEELRNMIQSEVTARMNEVKANAITKFKLEPVQ